MTAEREIAGFTLPFVVGTAASFLLPALSGAVFPACMAIMTAGLLLLIHPAHKTLSSKALWCIIAGIALACGIFTGHTGAIVSSTGIHTSGMVGARAHIFAESVRKCINDIPFADKSTNGLICALITGERSSLPQNIVASFRDSGAAHILALSGLHLGIIYGMIKILLSKIGGFRHQGLLRSVITVSACGFYTIATGAGASIVRAFIFILLGEAAAMTGRKKSLPSILMASLLLQTIIWPQTLKSISFQLSYAAMAGIAYIYPWLNRIWSGHTEGKGSGLKILDKIWDTAAISISCQIATGPLAWIYFGTVPVYFLITNLIAIPLVGLIIPVSLCTILLTSAGVCPTIAVKITELLTGLLTDSLNVISAL